MSEPVPEEVIANNQKDWSAKDFGEADYVDDDYIAANTQTVSEG